MLATTKKYQECVVDNEPFRIDMELRETPSSTSLQAWFHNGNISAFEYSDACIADTFGFGATYSKNIKFTIMNFDRKHSGNYIGYDLNLKVTSVPKNMDVAADWLDKGNYIVMSSQPKGNYIEVSAMDYMVKFNVPFKNSICIPGGEGGGEGNVTLKRLVVDICRYCGVDVSPNITFNESDRVLPNDYAQQYGLNKYSCRDIIGFVAQIALGYARINSSNRLEILSFASCERLRDLYSYDGGTFLKIDSQNQNAPYLDGDSIDGGDFITYAGEVPHENIYDGGGFTGLNYHAVNVMYEKEIYPQPKSWDGVVVESAYGGVFEHIRPLGSVHFNSAASIRGNPILYRSDNANTVADELYAAYCSDYNKRHYVQYDITTDTDPSREPGDIIIISTEEGQTYISIILNYHWKYGEGDNITADFGLEDKEDEWNDNDNVAQEGSD